MNEPIIKISKETEIIQPFGNAQAIIKSILSQNEAIIRQNEFLLKVICSPVCILRSDEVDMTSSK